MVKPGCQKKLKPILLYARGLEVESRLALPFGYNTDMKVAICDAESFYPLRDLVIGPLDTIEELAKAERFVRTAVLHDEMAMELTPDAYDPDIEAERSENERFVITAMGPTLEGFGFFKEDRNSPLQVPDIELTPSLVAVARKFSNASEGNAFFNSHIGYLKNVLGVVVSGGSALLSSPLGAAAVRKASKYPDALFKELDAQWQSYAKSAQEDGLGFVVPPVLGIVLTRSASRDAIPTVIKDLRDEWACARKKVWLLLDSLRACRTVNEAAEIRREIAEASRLFSPEETDLDSRPVRMLWEILAAPLSGVLVAQVSGGDPVKGAITNTIAQAARSTPGFIHEFGRKVFGLGAFDLARRVRRGAAGVEFDALKRLLTEAERKNLGL